MISENSPEQGQIDQYKSSEWSLNQSYFLLSGVVSENDIASTASSKIYFKSLMQGR